MQTINRNVIFFHRALHSTNSDINARHITYESTGRVSDNNIVDELQVTKISVIAALLAFFLVARRFVINLSVCGCPQLKVIFSYHVEAVTSAATDTCISKYCTVRPSTTHNSTTLYP